MQKLQNEEGIAVVRANKLTRTANIEAYLKEVEEHYVEDASHSLSIEGYRVTNNWNFARFLGALVEKGSR